MGDLGRWFGQRVALRTMSSLANPWMLGLRLPTMTRTALAGRWCCLPALQVMLLRRARALIGVGAEPQRDTPSMCL